MRVEKAFPWWATECSSGGLVGEKPNCNGPVKKGEGLVCSRLTKMVDKYSGFWVIAQK